MEGAGGSEGEGMFGRWWRRKVGEGLENKEAGERGRVLLRWIMER